MGFLLLELKVPEITPLPLQLYTELITQGFNEGKPLKLKYVWCFICCCTAQYEFLSYTNADRGEHDKYKYLQMELQ